MLTVLSRIIHYGSVSFWRNGWLSTATVAIMVLALLMLMGLTLFTEVTNQAIVSLQDKIDITAYFKTNTPEDQILNIKQSIESFSEVKQVEYVSRDQALELFKEKHKDDPTITQAINELNTNPLQASLNIKARNPGQYGTIAEYFSNSPNISQYVDSVSYYKNQIVIDRLNAIIANVNRGGFILTLVMSFIACLVIFNTIRLAIYSNREEIGIMRVVGASNIFVRGPYVVEGVISGILAAVMTTVIAAPITYVITPYMKVFIPTLDLFHYFYSHALNLFLYQLLFGILLGSLSSFFAVRRYLRN